MVGAVVVFIIFLIIGVIGSYKDKNNEKEKDDVVEINESNDERWGTGPKITLAVIICSFLLIPIISAINAGRDGGNVGNAFLVMFGLMIFVVCLYFGYSILKTGIELNRDDAKTIGTVMLLIDLLIIIIACNTSCEIYPTCTLDGLLK